MVVAGRDDGDTMVEEGGCEARVEKGSSGGLIVFAEIVVGGTDFGEGDLGNFQRKLVS